jgi:hypothetical protein
MRRICSYRSSRTATSWKTLGLIATMGIVLVVSCRVAIAGQVLIKGEEVVRFGHTVCANDSGTITCCTASGDSEYCKKGTAADMKRLKKLGIQAAVSAGAAGAKSPTGQGTGQKVTLTPTTTNRALQGGSILGGNSAGTTNSSTTKHPIPQAR